MQLELKSANEIMGTQILSLLTVVVRVVNFDLVLLRLLEVEVDEDFLDKLRVESVVNDLSLSQLLPHIALLLVHDDKWIRVGHGVHIGQVLALEANLKFIGQAATAEVGSC